MEFLYKAYADSGEVEEGRVAAAGKREAADELRSRGLHPMTIRKTGEKKKVSLFKRRRLADLAEEWESLLSAGIPVTETLDILGGGRSGKEKILLGEIKATIEAGHSIAESFAGSRAFPPFFTALLQVGELSGTIPEQLRLAAACYRKEEEFIAGMKSALSYPVFVLFFSFLVFALILTVILPSFAALFDALDIPLPAVTRAALALGLFLQEKGFYFLVELLLGAVGGVVWLRSERGKRSTDAFLFRFPFIRRLYLIRVTLALSALLKSGKTLSDALADIADIKGYRAGRRFCPKHGKILWRYRPCPHDPCRNGKRAASSLSGAERPPYDRGNEKETDRIQKDSGTFSFAFCRSCNSGNHIFRPASRFQCRGDAHGRLVSKDGN